MTLSMSHYGQSAAAQENNVQWGRIVTDILQVNDALMFNLAIMWENNCIDVLSLVLDELSHNGRTETSKQRV